jgi:uncharacterized protein YndB with AHSA1/START domain
MRTGGRFLAAALAGMSLAGAAHAEVVDAQANGFEVKASAQIAAPAAKVWAALGRIGDWWDPAHTYSRNAHNLTLELKLGGCLCETLPEGGGVRHMSVIFVQPGRAIRLDGALGPLQGLGVVGRLTWALTEKDGHTTLVQTYDVGGYAPGGADKLAAPVDGVLSEQLGRLAHYVETGAPS